MKQYLKNVYRLGTRFFCVQFTNLECFSWIIFWPKKESYAATIGGFSNKKLAVFKFHRTYCRTLPELYAKKLSG